RHRVEVRADRHDVGAVGERQGERADVVEVDRLQVAEGDRGPGDGDGAAAVGGGVGRVDDDLAAGAADGEAVGAAGAAVEGDAAGRQRVAAGVVDPQRVVGAARPGDLHGGDADVRPGHQDGAGEGAQLEVGAVAD